MIHIHALSRIDHSIYCCRSCSADILATPTHCWNELTFWTFHSCSMVKPPTNLISMMDLDDTMHREMIHYATDKDLSTYTRGNGWKWYVFNLMRKTTVPSHPNTYTIKTNVERCLQYISSNMQKDFRLSLNLDNRQNRPQSSKIVTFSLKSTLSSRFKGYDQSNYT